MIALQTNVSAVIRRLERAAARWERRVWRAFVREADFEGSTRATLEAMLLPVERPWLEPILKGLDATLRDSVFTLYVRFQPGQTDARFDADDASVERAVRAWTGAPVVGDGSPDESGKRIDIEDIAASVQASLTPEEAAARRVLSILGLGRPLWGPGDHDGGAVTLTKAEAAEVLRDRLQRFLDATGGGELTPERVRELLRGVLAGWAGLCRLLFPMIAARELKHAYEA